MCEAIKQGYKNAEGSHTFRTRLKWNFIIVNADTFSMFKPHKKFFGWIVANMKYILSSGWIMQ